MKYWQNKLGVKLAVTVTLILIPLLLASFIWLEFRAESMGKNEQEARAAQLGESLVTTLSSIMLSGNADIAHFWLERVASVPGVESAKIFRPDGVEAFQDQSTLNLVNSFVGESALFAIPSASRASCPPNSLNSLTKRAKELLKLSALPTASF